MSLDAARALTYDTEFSRVVRHASLPQHGRACLPYATMYFGLRDLVDNQLLDAVFQHIWGLVSEPTSDGQQYVCSRAGWRIACYLIERCLEGACLPQCLCPDLVKWATSSGGEIPCLASEVGPLATPWRAASPEWPREKLLPPWGQQAVPQSGRQQPWYPEEYYEYGEFGGGHTSGEYVEQQHYAYPSPGYSRTGEGWSSPGSAGAPAHGSAAVSLKETEDEATRWGAVGEPSLASAASDHDASGPCLGSGDAAEAAVETVATPQVGKRMTEWEDIRRVALARERERVLCAADVEAASIAQLGVAALSFPLSNAGLRWSNQLLDRPPTPSGSSAAAGPTEAPAAAQTAAPPAAGIACATMRCDPLWLARLLDEAGTDDDEEEEYHTADDGDSLPDSLAAMLRKKGLPRTTPRALQERVDFEADQDARRVAGDLSSPAADATLDGRWRDAHHRKRELQAAVGSMSEAALRAQAARLWPEASENWPSDANVASLRAHVVATVENKESRRVHAQMEKRAVTKRPDRLCESPVAWPSYD